MTAGDRRQRPARVVAVAAGLLVLAAPPAVACSPAEHAVFDEVVAPHDRDGGRRTYVGVIERRVIAHGPGVPLLASQRSVWVRSRTWGDVSDVSVPDRRHGEYLTALTFFAFCPPPPAPRVGDVVMTAVMEGHGGDRRAVPMATGPHLFDPTFPGGLTPGQEAELAARLGAPEVLPAPSRSAFVRAWVWSWLPWLMIVVLAGGAAGGILMWGRRHRYGGPPGPPRPAASPPRVSR